MPVTIEINASVKAVFTTFAGEIGGDDLRSARVELANRPDFDPAFSHIIDFHGVTKANVSTEFLRDFAEEKSIFRRDAKQIIVAPAPHIFGLSRMTQILMQGQSPNIKVVRSLAEACSALGIKQAG